MTHGAQMAEPVSVKDRAALFDDNRNFADTMSDAEVMRFTCSEFLSNDITDAPDAYIRAAFRTLCDGDPRMAGSAGRWAAHNAERADPPTGAIN